MAKGTEATAMEIDGGKSEISEKINPKFTINGLNLNFFPFFDWKLFFLKKIKFLCNFFLFYCSLSVAAVEIGSNAAWIAARGLHSISVCVCVCFLVNLQWFWMSDVVLKLLVIDLVDFLFLGLVWENGNSIKEPVCLFNQY